MLQKEVVQGNGRVVEETRSVGGFQHLKSEGPIDIILTPEEGPLRVRSDSNLLPYITTEVEGKELTIELEERVQTNSELSVTVPAQDLERLEHSGSGNVSSEGKFRWGQLKVVKEGSGDISLHMSAKEFHFVSKGTGNSHFRGNAERFKVENEGSGDVDALDLMATRVECHAEGSGDVKVDATVKLIVESEGSGDLIYKRAPPNINIQTEGEGSVKESQ